MKSIQNLCCTGACSSASLYRERPILREHIDPEDTLLGIYKSFWDGCPWEVFLIPDGPDGRVRVHGESGSVPAKPAVYEFALVMRDCTHAKVPVYIGESTNVQQRHRSYAQDGSSLAALINEMVGKRKYLLYRRVHVVENKNQAERWEARFLILFDYAWNAKLNVGKRNLEISVVSCCCFLPGVRVVSEDGSNKSLIVSKQNIALCWYLYAVIYVMEVVSCIIVVVLIATKLDAALVVIGEGEQAGATRVCWVGADPLDSVLCTYGYVSMSLCLAHGTVAMVLLAIFNTQFQTRKAQICGFISTFVTAILALVWALVYVSSGMNESSRSMPHQSARDTIEIVSWVLLGCVCMPLVQKICQVLFYLLFL